MQADERAAAEVMEVIQRQLNAYLAKDLDGVMACFLPDPALICYGTNLDQKLRGLDEVRAAYLDDFEGFDRAELSLVWSQVSCLGEVAWVAADYRASISVEGEEAESMARATTVLVKHGGQWLIAQSHLSFPADTSGVSGPAVVL